jgi:hypothetical protein
MKDALCLVVTLLLTSLGVHAQGLPDPTRPALEVGQSDRSGSTDATPSGPVLQMVVSGANQRSRALISGDWVEERMTWRGYRVKAIGTDFVILRNLEGKEETRVQLTPVVRKDSAAAASVSARKNSAGAAPGVGR